MVGEALAQAAGSAKRLTLTEAAAVVPSAISNAVFDATGVRLRSVPYTPEKVKAAMRGAA